MAKCHITGILELPSSPTSTPVPAASAVFRILSGISDTEILVNTAQDIPVGADGSVSFYATQGATLWIYSNAKGFDDDIENGTPFLIPETATAQVMALQANVSLPTQVPIAVGSVTIEIDTGGQFFDVTDSVDELPGADPTGVADSTAAILRTIAAAHVAGGVVFFPEGDYLVSGVGAQLFLITRGLLIRGAGRMNSRIMVAASVPSTTDIFRFAPDTNPHGRGFEVSDLGFEPVSGNPGRYAINLDGSLESIYSFKIEKCWSGELGNYFVATTNVLNQDGIFTGVIADNLVVKFVGLGGILIRGGGDSIQIERNTLLVESYSIDAEFLADIGSTRICSNNLTGTKGVRIVGGRGTVVCHNNIELVSTDTGFNGAALDFDGAADNIIQGPQIHDNAFNIRPDTPIDAIRFQYVQGGHVYGNEIVIGAGKFGLRVKNTSTGTIVGVNHVRDAVLAETILQTYVNEGDASLVFAATLHEVMPALGSGQQGNLATRNAVMNRVRLYASTGPSTAELSVSESDFLQLSANRNTLTGDRYNTSKTSAHLFIHTGNGDSYIVLGTTPTNNTIPVDRFKVDKNGLLQASAYGAGTATFDASGNITSVSDERLKNITGSFTRGLADVLQLAPITYEWSKDSGYDRDGKGQYKPHSYAGFSTQNVLLGIPEAIGMSEAGYYSLADRPIIAALVNSVKELNAKIESLQADKRAKRKR